MSLKKLFAACFAARSRSARLRDRFRKHTGNTTLRFEPLEDRRLLAIGDFCTLAADGGDGTAAFVSGGLAANDAASGDINDDGDADSPVAKKSLTANLQSSRGPKRFSINDVEVSEADGTAVFTVKRTGDTSKPASVSYRTLTKGTATPGVDYITQTGRLDFGDKSEMSVTITVIDDVMEEPDKTFFVELFDPRGATLGDREGQGTIVDDDRTGPVGSGIYVDQFFQQPLETRGRQTYQQFTVVVKKDLADEHGDFGTQDENDILAEGVVVAVKLMDTSLGPGDHDGVGGHFLGSTNEAGEFHTRRIKGFDPGREYLVEVVLMELEGYAWAQDPDDELGYDVDHDGDGIPSFIMSL